MPNAGILKQLVDETGYTVSRLEREMGYSNGALAKAIKQNGILKQERIDKLFSIFPNLNRGWLNSGKGSIFLKNNEIANGVGGNNPVVQTIPESNAIPVGAPVGRHVTSTGNQLLKMENGEYVFFTPLVHAKAQAGYLTGWGDEEYMEELPLFGIFVKEPPLGRYMSFTIVGDSMDDGSEDQIKDGWIATGRKINRSHWQNKLHLHQYKDYIIHHKEGIMCKRITDHDVEIGEITCHSLNPDKKQYPDFVLQLDDVVELFNIIQTNKPR